MNANRRYGEDDIRQICERAGSTDGAGQRTDVSSEGLTLEECGHAGSLTRSLTLRCSLEPSRRESHHATGREFCDRHEGSVNPQLSDIGSE
jgi:hypothetical protein